MREFTPKLGEGWADQETPTQEIVEVDLTALEKHGIQPLADTVDAHGLMTQIDQEQQVGYGKFFGFGYHSIAKEGRDEVDVEKTDTDAYREIAGTPGFYGYFPGQKDMDRKCTTICIWKDIETASNTLKNSPMHAVAVDKAPEFYDVGVLEYVDIDYTPDGTTVSHIMPPFEFNLNPA